MSKTQQRIADAIQTPEGRCDSALRVPDSGYKCTGCGHVNPDPIPTILVLANKCPMCKPPSDVKPVCPHGQLARSCPICERDETIKGLREVLANVEVQSDDIAKHTDCGTAGGACQYKGEGGPCLMCIFNAQGRALKDAKDFIRSIREEIFSNQPRIRLVKDWFNARESRTALSGGTP